MLAAFARTNVVTHHLVGHFLERGDHIAATESEDGIQMHGCAATGHLTGHHTVGLAALEQRVGQLSDRLRGAALAHANQDTTVANGHDVAALQGGKAVVLERVAPDLLKPCRRTWDESGKPPSSAASPAGVP